ncbi:MAG: hypothetical protein HY014_05415 [Acidobacteria bacterium]|nr:hypothetical protein [Acidobacteriota bacterium]MBI3487591.1 hypothetical protein [Acidobacteriota bacterium]
MNTIRIPNLMEIPQNNEGDRDLLPVAWALLLDLPKQEPGFRYKILGNLEGEGGWFQARCEPDGTLTVQKECIATRLGGTLFFALSELAPDLVRVEP